MCCIIGRLHRNDINMYNFIIYQLKKLINIGYDSIGIVIYDKEYNKFNITKKVFVNENINTFFNKKKY